MGSGLFGGVTFHGPSNDNAAIETLLLGHLSCQDVVDLSPGERLVFAVELPLLGQDRADCVQSKPSRSQGTDTSDDLLFSKARSHSVANDFITVLRISIQWLTPLSLVAESSQNAFTRHLSLHFCESAEERKEEFSDRAGRIKLLTDGVQCYLVPVHEPGHLQHI